jgi:hypothetical protein
MKQSFCWADFGQEKRRFVLADDDDDVYCIGTESLVAQLVYERSRMHADRT